MDGNLSFSNLLVRMSNPARSALMAEGIDSYEKLVSLSEEEFLALHGIGKASLPLVKEYLKLNGLAFRAPQ